MKKKKVVKGIHKFYVILLFLFFYLPVGVMVAFSFNTSKANVVWQGFTTKWYAELMTDIELWSRFRAGSGSIPEKISGLRQVPAHSSRMNWESTG